MTEIDAAKDEEEEESVEADTNVIEVEKDAWKAILEASYVAMDKDSDQVISEQELSASFKDVLKAEPFWKNFNDGAGGFDKTSFTEHFANLAEQKGWSDGQTMEMVKGWVANNLNDETVAAMKEALKASIEE